MGFMKQKFRNIKKFPDWLFLPIVGLMYFYKILMRRRYDDRVGVLQNPNPPGIAVTWHNRLMFFPLMFPKKLRRCTSAVISASRDGQYVADLVHWMGIDSIRGSSSKKGMNAVNGAVKALQANRYVAFTPDGPRGPRYHMSSGPIYLASRFQVPVYPVSVNYSSCWELKSWDRFQIPKPFAKVTLVIGEAIHIPPDLTDEEAEQWRVTVENKLKEVAEVKES